MPREPQPRAQSAPLEPVILAWFTDLARAAHTAGVPACWSLASLRSATRLPSDDRRGYQARCCSPSPFIARAACMCNACAAYASGQRARRNLCMKSGCFDRQIAKFSRCAAQPMVGRAASRAVTGFPAMIPLSLSFVRHLLGFRVGGAGAVTRQSVRRQASAHSSVPERS